MAHDIFAGSSKRDWSRDSQPTSTSGYDPYARSLFERRGCSEQPTIIVEKKTGMGWFGYTMAAMFATRMLSGKWPWYWAQLGAKKLEGTHTSSKG